MRKKRKTRKRPKKRRKRRAIKKRKKVVFLVIDGLADLPIDKKTPLSEANKPNLDYMSKNGITGRLQVLTKSLWEKTIARTSISHLANISLLGYNPKKYHFKRGPLEAVGSNLPYKEGHLALRCNFATVDKDLIVKDRRAGRNSLGLDKITRYINENVKIGPRFVFMRTYGHRAALIIKMSLSDKISEGDPEFVGKKVKKVSALKKDALVSAKVVQDFIDKSHDLIEYHPVNAKRIEQGILPANYILTREAGNNLAALPDFKRKHRIKKAVCVAENGVIKATCLLAGFDSITVKEEDVDKSLDFIFDSIKNALIEYDFVFAHIKGVDEAAHDGNFDLKKKRIEEIDKKLEAFRNFRGVLIVTCDHITSCETKKHMYGPVPVLVFGKDKDKVKTFDEFSVKKGKLKNYTGKKLWEFVFK